MNSNANTFVTNGKSVTFTANIFSIMLTSMTGYGKAEMQMTGKKIIAEVRSLNSKQLDLNVKLPLRYREVEMEIRSIVSELMVRGKVDFQIFIEDDEAASVTPINEAIFDGYFSQVKQISDKYGLNINNELLIQTILRLPDVMKSPKDDVEESEYNVVKDVAKLAVLQLNEFRVQEGNALAADIVKRVNNILAFLEQVAPFESSRIETIKVRLSDNLKGISENVKVDADRFEQELIYYLEKLDITEEKVRLKNHCKYFLETVKSDEPVGRKLGFIAQEMGREINTLGSKANNVDIQKLVVRMKDELEKIKEQSLNIL